MPLIGRRDALAGIAASAVLPASRSRAQAASTWDQIAATGKLRMGLIPGRAPYQWLVDGKVQGFIDTMSQDCAAKLGAKMGKPIAVDYVTTTNQTTILDLQANRMDAFIPLTVTPERRAAIDMFEPLYLMPVVAFNRKGFDPGPNWEDYNKADTRIAVVMGTTDELAARRRLPAVTIRSLKNTSEAILEVQAGHSDAVVMGLLLGLVGVKNNGNLGAITLLQPLEAPPSGGGTRKDGDGRFAAFMQEWTTGFHAAGGSASAIRGAMKEAGLDVASIPAGVTF